MYRLYKKEEKHSNFMLFDVTHISVQMFNMKSIIFTLCTIIVLCDIINSLPNNRFHNRKRRSVRFPSPSGSIPGTAYYRN